jgi:hypothetical protein
MWNDLGNQSVENTTKSGRLDSGVTRPTDAGGRARGHRMHRQAG